MLKYEQSDRQLLADTVYRQLCGPGWSVGPSYGRRLDIACAGAPTSPYADATTSRYPPRVANWPRTYLTDWTARMFSS